MFDVAQRPSSFGRKIRLIYQNISNVPTQNLLGRATAGTGAAEAIPLTSNLKFTSGSLDTVQGILTTSNPTFAGLLMTQAQNNATLQLQATLGGSVSDYLIQATGGIGLGQALGFYGVTAAAYRMVMTGNGNFLIGSTSEAGISVNGSIKPLGYAAADGSQGISTTVTTALLVGKTITFKNGIVTAFA